MQPSFKDENVAVLEQIEQVRDLLNRADERDDLKAAVGDLIIAISRMVDVAEAIIRARALFERRIA